MISNLDKLEEPGGLFSLIEVVGKGTYGNVYRGVDKRTGQSVAVKVMEINPSEKDEILLEVNTLKRLSNHLNVASYFGSFVQHERSSQKLWIVMEFCSAGSITDLVKSTSGQSLKEEWISYICREILEGLIHLHINHVIHRDIKGQNVLLTDKAEVKLVDFGVCAQLDRTLDKRNTFIGTPFWMAPEVIHCENNSSSSYDERSDIWSLGITAIEMAEGRPPLCEIHPMRALFLIKKNPPPKLKSPKWSATFKSFLDKSLKKKYQERPTAKSLRSHSFVNSIINERQVILQLRDVIMRKSEKKNFRKGLPDVKHEPAAKPPEQYKDLPTKADETLKVKPKPAPFAENENTVDEEFDPQTLQKSFALLQANENDPSANIPVRVKQGHSPGVSKVVDSEVDVQDTLTPKQNRRNSAINVQPLQPSQRRVESPYLHRKFSEGNSRIPELRASDRTKFVSRPKIPISRPMSSVIGDDVTKRLQSKFTPVDNSISLSTLLTNTVITEENEITCKSPVDISPRKSSIDILNRLSQYDNSQISVKPISQPPPPVSNNPNEQIKVNDVLPDVLPRSEKRLLKQSSTHSFESFQNNNINNNFQNRNLPSRHSISANLYSSSSVTELDATPPKKTLQTIDINGTSNKEELLKKKLSGEVHCAAFWGVNVIIGSYIGLDMVDRSGSGKVYHLVQKRRFLQIEVLEEIQSLIAISGKSRKLQQYSLDFFSAKILEKEHEKNAGVYNIGECVREAFNFKIVKFKEIIFLVVAFPCSIAIYSWAQRPFNKFMEYKKYDDLCCQPLLVNLTIENANAVKILYASKKGFYAINLNDNNQVDLFIPNPPMVPYSIMIIPDNSGSNLLLCYNSEAVFVNTSGQTLKNVVMKWSGEPIAVSPVSNNRFIVWGHKAFEVRLMTTGELKGIQQHKEDFKERFLCEQNGKIVYSSFKSLSSQQVGIKSLGGVTW